MKAILAPPNSATQRDYLLRQFRDYWPRGAQALRDLPIPEASFFPVELPPSMAEVTLPEWASDIGEEGRLLLPAAWAGEWHRVPWWSVLFWYVSGWAERRAEMASGPIHSYSHRLAGWDARIWDRAWSNRIALFLRRWGAQIVGSEAESLFGPLPEARLELTHDVDAIRKTWAIRGKQTAFHLINAGRALLKRSPRKAWHKMAHALRFALATPSYWGFDEIKRMEEAHGVKSTFHMYADLGPGRSWKQRLIDPGYEISEAPLVACLNTLVEGGWRVGLHPSHAHWASPEDLRRERERVESALGLSIERVRMHWLYFSWELTWKSMQRAGLRHDATLGFNNRPGFRTGTALAFQPWDFESGAPMDFTALPMMLMDSHLYDYADASEAQREASMAYWLEELRVVHGTASIIWHLQVMNADYGWAPGYERILGIWGARRGA